MYSIFCLLLPSLISLSIDEKLLNKNYKLKDVLTNYGIYCLINNVIVLIISVFIFNIKYNLEEQLVSFPGVTVKYALASIMVSVITSIVKVIIVKNIGVKIEIENKKNNQ